MMEHSSLDILAVVIVDKRETNLKSTNMERHGFKKAMEMLIAHGINIKEVVTDQHSGIIGLMSKLYYGLYYEMFTQ